MIGLIVHPNTPYPLPEPDRDSSGPKRPFALIYIAVMTLIGLFGVILASGAAKFAWWLWRAAL